MRVVKLVRHLESLQRLISVISTSLRDIGYISALLALFLCIYALIGLQFFGGKFNFVDGKPRANFDNFGRAVLSVFQLVRRCLASSYSYYYYLFT
jgi:hypothetical protein